MTIIKIRTGDTSHDGHGLFRLTLYDISCSRSELHQFYKKGCEIVGFDLYRDVASDYEDSHIEGANLQSLIRAGYPVDELEDYDEEEDEEEQTAWLNHDAFVRIYLFIAKLGAGDHIFSCQKILQEAEHHDIGGYGLYST